MEDTMASNEALSRIIDQVIAGREKLRAAAPAAELADVQLSEEGGET
jgi:hypothetical protein